MKLLLLTIVLTVITSCTSLPKKTLKNIELLKAAQMQEQVVQRKLDNKTKIYVDGALRALQEDNGKGKDVALRLLKNASEIMGPPLPPDKLDTIALANNDKAAIKALTTLEAEHKELIVEKSTLVEKVNTLNETINSQAQKLAEIANVSWFDKLKGSITTFIIIFAICFVLIMFGPALFKILIKLIKL